MRAAFERDAQAGLGFKGPPQRGFCALYAPFLDQAAATIQQAIVTHPVAQIQAHGHLRLVGHFHLSHLFANLLHWLVSF